MISDTTLDLMTAFRNYGCVVVAEPIDGMEDRFNDTLRGQLAEIERLTKRARSEYGYRGRSKRVLALIHREIIKRDSFWGVEPMERHA